MSNPVVKVSVSGPNVEATSQHKTKILKAGIPFADQVREPNMRYVIKWNFDLEGSCHDLDLTTGGTHSIAGVTYYYKQIVANGKKYTLFDDDLVFIDSEWNGLSAREIAPAKGTVFMIGSVTSKVYYNCYGINAVIIPENCILEFSGGIIFNGVIVLDGCAVYPSYDPFIAEGLTVIGLPKAGTVRWDDDNNRPIWSNGSEWVDATGTTVS